MISLYPFYIDIYNQKKNTRIDQINAKKGMSQLLQ